jgi:hypothetical protein
MSERLVIPDRSDVQSALSVDYLWWEFAACYNVANWQLRRWNKLLKATAPDEKHPKRIAVKVAMGRYCPSSLRTSNDCISRRLSAMT